MAPEISPTLIGDSWTSFQGSTYRDTRFLARGDCNETLAVEIHAIFERKTRPDPVAYRVVVPQGLIVQSSQAADFTVLRRGDLCSPTDSMITD